MTSTPTTDPAAAALRAIGGRVRAARVRGRLTQQQLAGAAGVSRSSIANIESGRQNVTVRHVAALAVALHVDVGDLLRLG